VSQLADVPAVASFDIAFHGTIPLTAATYPVPREWRARYGIRRYGFHGLAHAFTSRRAAGLAGRSTPGLRVITCHLGAGCSLAAVLSGRRVDSTMGFTPLEGLVMATRSGPDRAWARALTRGARTLDPPRGRHSSGGAVRAPRPGRHR